MTYGLNIQILFNARVPTRSSLGVHLNAFQPPLAPQEIFAIAITTEYAASAPLDITAQAPTQAFILHLNALPENTAIKRDFQLIREIVRLDLILLAGQHLYRAPPVPLANTAVQQDYQLIRATARRDLIQLAAQQK